jgi:hypothetical protein
MAADANPSATKSKSFSDLELLALKCTSKMEKRKFKNLAHRRKVTVKLCFTESDHQEHYDRRNISNIIVGVIGLPYKEQQDEVLSSTCGHDSHSDGSRGVGRSNNLFRLLYDVCRFPKEKEERSIGYFQEEHANYYTHCLI